MGRKNKENPNKNEDSEINRKKRKRNENNNNGNNQNNSNNDTTQEKKDEEPIIPIDRQLTGVKFTSTGLVDFIDEEVITPRVFDRTKKNVSAEKEIADLSFMEDVKASDEEEEQEADKEKEEEEEEEEEEKKKKEKKEKKDNEEGCSDKSERGDESSDDSEKGNESEHSNYLRSETNVKEKANYASPLKKECDRSFIYSMDETPKKCNVYITEKDYESTSKKYKTPCEIDMLKPDKNLIGNKCITINNYVSPPKYFRNHVCQSKFPLSGDVDPHAMEYSEFQGLFKNKICLLTEQEFRESTENSKLKAKNTEEYLRMQTEQHVKWPLNANENEESSDVNQTPKRSCTFAGNERESSTSTANTSSNMYNDMNNMSNSSYLRSPSKRRPSPNKQGGFSTKRILEALNIPPANNNNTPEKTIRSASANDKGNKKAEMEKKRRKKEEDALIDFEVKPILKTENNNSNRKVILIKVIKQEGKKKEEKANNKGMNKTKVMNTGGGNPDPKDDGDNDDDDDDKKDKGNKKGTNNNNEKDDNEMKKQMDKKEEEKKEKNDKEEEAKDPKKEIKKEGEEEKEQVNREEVPVDSLVMKDLAKNQFNPVPTEFKPYSENLDDLFKDKECVTANKVLQIYNALILVISRRVKLSQPIYFRLIKKEMNHLLGRIPFDDEGLRQIAWLAPQLIVLNRIVVKDDILLGNVEAYPEYQNGKAVEDIEIRENLESNQDLLNCSSKDKKEMFQRIIINWANVKHNELLRTINPNFYMPFYFELKKWHSQFKFGDVIYPVVSIENDKTMADLSFTPHESNTDDFFVQNDSPLKTVQTQLQIEKNNVFAREIEKDQTRTPLGKNRRRSNSPLSFSSMSMNITTPKSAGTPRKETNNMEKIRQAANKKRIVNEIKEELEGEEQNLLSEKRYWDRAKWMGEILHDVFIVEGIHTVIDLKAFSKKIADKYKSNKTFDMDEEAVAEVIETLSEYIPDIKIKPGLTDKTKKNLSVQSKKNLALFIDPIARKAEVISKRYNQLKSEKEQRMNNLWKEKNVSFELTENIKKYLLNPGMTLDKL